MQPDRRLGGSEAAKGQQGQPQAKRATVPGDKGSLRYATV